MIAAGASVAPLWWLRYQRAQFIPEWNRQRAVGGRGKGPAQAGEVDGGSAASRGARPMGLFVATSATSWSTSPQIDPKRQPSLPRIRARLAGPDDPTGGFRMRATECRSSSNRRMRRVARASALSRTDCVDSKNPCDCKLTGPAEAETRTRGGAGWQPSKRHVRAKPPSKAAKPAVQGHSGQTVAARLAKPVAKGDSLLQRQAPGRSGHQRIVCASFPLGNDIELYSTV